VNYADLAGEGDGSDPHDSMDGDYEDDSLTGKRRAPSAGGQPNKRSGQRSSSSVTNASSNNTNGGAGPNPPPSAETDAPLPDDKHTRHQKLVAFVANQPQAAFFESHYLRIYSQNMDGMRAKLGRNERWLHDLVVALGYPDILAFQEIKLQAENVPGVHDMCFELGYVAVFSVCTVDGRLGSSGTLVLFRGKVAPGAMDKIIASWGPAAAGGVPPPTKYSNLATAAERAAAAAMTVNLYVTDVTFEIDGTQHFLGEGRYVLLRCVDFIVASIYAVNIGSSKARADMRTENDKVICAAAVQYKVNDIGFVMVGDMNTSPCNNDLSATATRYPSKSGIFNVHFRPPHPPLQLQPFPLPPLPRRLHPL
jgi:exonuclease III